MESKFKNSTKHYESEENEEEEIDEIDEMIDRYKYNN